MASITKKKKGRQPKKEVLVEKILFLETNSQYYSFFRNMYLTLGRFCNHLLYFNRREMYFKYGKRKMNEMLLKLIEKEKPDYVFTWLTWDEFYIETLLKINKISPKTKTVVIFGDDTIQFNDFSRFYTLLFNYTFTTLKSYQKKYQREGIKNSFFTSLTDVENFHPIGTEKKYEVTFIGSQKLDKSGRYEYIKYLKNNGINIRVFGFGWENFSDLKDIYGGALESEAVVNVINQSKINLCFSRDNFGRPQMKAKIFEVGACKSFSLCEYASDYDSYFTKDKDIVFFSSKEELLKKVQYYLKNSQEREKVTEAAYKTVVSKYALHSELKNFIKKTRDERPTINLPEVSKRTIILTENEMNLNINKLEALLKDKDYICFQKGNAEKLQFNEYFHVYAIEKSKKEISCCNYYMHRKGLGDYMLFFTRDGLNLLSKEKFDMLLDINQLVMTKKYFLQNYQEVKNCFYGGTIKFVNKENTAFMAIPLLRLRNMKTKDYKIIKEAFGFKFIYELYSLLYQKNVFFSLYPYILFFEAFTTKHFIRKAIIDYISDRNIWAKIKKTS